MQFLLDNLLATVVSAMVLLILAGVRMGQMEESVERLREYAARQQQATFLETLRGDMHNVVALEDTGIMGADSSFSFQAVLDSNLSTVGRVTYRLEYARTEREGEGPSATLHRIYRLVRAVGPGNTTVAARLGASAITASSEAVLLNSVNNVSIVVKNDQDSPVTMDQVAIKGTEIHFIAGLISPYVGTRQRVALRDVGQLTWDARYRPNHLRGRTL